MVQKYINDLERLIATNLKEGKRSERYLTKRREGRNPKNQDSWGMNRQTRGEAEKNNAHENIETIIKEKGSVKSAGRDQTNVRVLYP